MSAGSPLHRLLLGARQALITPVRIDPRNTAVKPDAFAREIIRRKAIDLVWGHLLAERVNDLVAMAASAGIEISPDELATRLLSRYARWYRKHFGEGDE